MNTPRAWVAACLAATAVLLIPQTSVRAAPLPLTDENVDAAIKRGVEHLLSQINEEGHWDLTEKDIQKRIDGYIKTLKDQGKPVPPRETVEQNLRTTFNRDCTGYSCLALIALLNGGVEPTKPEMVKALSWVAEQNPTGTYALGLRCVLWATLDSPRIHRLLNEEAKSLQEGIWPYGTYNYYMRPAAKFDAGPIGDLSNTQYGLLGVWAGADRGVEIAQKYWKCIEHGYLDVQDKNGGWRYPVKPGEKPADNAPRLSVSLGAIAGLFIIWDYYYARESCDAKPNPELVKALSKGIEFAGKELAKVTKDGVLSLHAYSLYGLERAGVASGLKYFGDVDWYKAGATYAVRHQGAKGGWGDITTTSWTLLFLEFGAAPVVFNKLAWGEMGDWNVKPRDLARETFWLYRSTEKHYNWQIMPIERPLEELWDAPILVMSSKNAIKLAPEQKAKLKEYVLGGGLLLGESAGGSKTFADSFRALIRELFPEMEMSPLPPTHPVYSIQFPLAAKQGGLPSNVPRLEGLVNGVRTMVILAPSDLTCAWQQYDIVNKRAHFELGANLVQYVSDKQAGLLRRGNSYLIKDQGNKPARQAVVGRLVWGSKYQWDPEPYGWKRLDICLRNANLMGVTTKECDLATTPDAKALPLLHVTGVGPISLTDAQKDNLKKYVNDGGMVLADPAGGNKPFLESFTKLAGDLFSMPVPANPPFLAAASENGKVQVRHLNGLPRTMVAPAIMGCPLANAPGRWGVLILPYDLTAALAGYSNAEPVGLTPKAAEKFVGALLGSPDIVAAQ